VSIATSFGAFGLLENLQLQHRIDVGEEDVFALAVGLRQHGLKRSKTFSCVSSVSQLLRLKSYFPRQKNDGPDVSRVKPPRSTPRLLRNVVCSSGKSLPTTATKRTGEKKLAEVEKKVAEAA
jgi:hypothetical protein